MINSCTSEAAKLCTSDAVEILSQCNYQKSGLPGIKQYQAKLKNLLCNSVDIHQRPYAAMVTVWLAPNKSISDLTDFITEYVANSPVSNGMRHTHNGPVPKTRSRGKFLTMWVREVKVPNAKDSHSTTGEHFHLAVCWDSMRTSKWGFLPVLFAAAVTKGIIQEPTEKWPRPWKVTGGRDLYTKAGLTGSFRHLGYLVKVNTKQKTPRKRNMGSSELRNLYQLKK